MFRENLRDIIDFKGLRTKELSALTKINKRTIDSYLDNRAVIPNAEVAVKLAKALGTTVEFLVTGEDSANPGQKIYSDFDTYRKYKKIVNELDTLSPDLLKSIETMIHSAAELSKEAK